MSIFEYDEERELIKRAEFKCGKEEGIELGKTQGLSQGITALIETCRDLGASREAVILALVKQFSLSEEEARRQTEKLWPMTETKA